MHYLIGYMMQMKHSQSKENKKNTPERNSIKKAILTKTYGEEKSNVLAQYLIFAKFSNERGFPEIKFKILLETKDIHILKRILFAS